MVQSITLQNTADADIVNNDILGQLCFAAPNEAGGTDSILIAASIFARSEGTFAANNNATELVFVTGASESAAPGATNYDMTLSSAGLLTLTGNLVIPDAGNIGSASDTNAIAIASDGVVTMDQIPVFSAGINVSGGTIAGTIATATQNSITTMTGLVTVGTIGTGVWQGTKIASGYIANDAIDSQHYADGSIDNAHIADDAIDSEHYADGSIDNAHIADDAIDSEHYAAASIDFAHIQNVAANSILGRNANSSGVLSEIALATTQILIGDGTGFTPAALSGDATMTNAGVVSLAANSVDSDQYVDASIDTAHIAADQITSALIADDQIDSEHYVDGSIDNAHIADDAIDSEHYAAGSIDTAHIADNQVTLAKMAGITRGSIIIGDASGDPAALGIGSNTYVLTSDGTDIAWAAAGGGSSRSVAGDTGNGVVTWVTGDNTFAAEANFQMDGTDLLLTSATASKPVFTIQNTNNGATSGYLKFVNDKGGAGDTNDVCGTITFYGDDANQDNLEFARIEGMVAVPDEGQEGGKIKLSVASHDGEINQGLLIIDGSAEDEVDVTIGNGSASVVTIPGHIDLAGDIDVDGTLEADAITLGGTALGSLYSVIAGSSSIVTVGTIATGVWNGTAIATAYIADDAVTGAKIALFDDSLAATTTHFLIADGTDYSSFALSGDVTCTNAGVVSLAANSVDSDQYVDGSIDNVHLADDAVDSDELAAGAVDTAHIADDQVTLAKMAGITRGGIIIGDASGNPAALAISSTDGHVLTSDGTDIAWEAAAGGGGTPTAITVADESSDTTCFPLFVTAATGDLGPKSGSNLTFNSSTGVLTATGFAGPITGNVTGNASGTALTVTQAAQTAITTVGTLTTLTVDSIIINGTTIGHTSVDDAITIAAEGDVTFSKATKPSAPAAASGTADIVVLDCNTTNHFTITTSGNITGWNFTNASPGQRIIVRVTNGASHTVAFSATGDGDVIRFPGGTAPTLTTSGGIDVYGFLCIAADNFDGFVIGQALA